MKLLDEAFREKLMDVRLRDKLLHEGKITQTQVDEYLASLEEESVAEEEED